MYFYENRERQRNYLKTKINKKMHVRRKFDSK